PTMTRKAGNLVARMTFSMSNAVELFVFISGELVLGYCSRKKAVPGALVICNPLNGMPLVTVSQLPEARLVVICRTQFVAEAGQTTTGMPPTVVMPGTSGTAVIIISPLGEPSG